MRRGGKTCSRVLSYPKNEKTKESNQKRTILRSREKEKSVLFSYFSRQPGGDSRSGESSRDATERLVLMDSCSTARSSDFEPVASASDASVLVNEARSGGSVYTM